MKYIRTKYGVYKIIEEDLTMYYCNDNNRCLDKIHNLIIFDAHRKDEKDIRVADTIEELCDEFVVKHINNEKPYITDNYQKHDLLKDRQKAYEYGVEIVYGAIWTSKGLIYVAKMDSEGKLVLI